jgi:hypothetical protein
MHTLARYLSLTPSGSLDIIMRGKDINIGTLAYHDAINIGTSITSRSINLGSAQWAYQQM